MLFPTFNLIRQNSSGKLSPHRYLFAPFLVLVFLLGARAETVFVVNMDGAQTVPMNNSGAKGFGVIAERFRSSYQAQN